MTKPDVLFGQCSAFQIQTEWCAGEVLRTPKRFIFCERYSKCPPDPHFLMMKKIAAQATTMQTRPTA
jgi:hypothetical protein